MTGGSFLNGAIGGAVNGWMTSVGACFGRVGYTDFAGGFVGNDITESLNDRDITDPNKPKKGQEKIILTSIGIGFTQSWRANDAEGRSRTGQRNSRILGCKILWEECRVYLIIGCLYTD